MKTLRKTHRILFRELDLEKRETFSCLCWLETHQRAKNNPQIFEDAAKMDQISSYYDCCVTTAAVRWVILPTHHPRSHPSSLIFKVSEFDFNLFYEILHTPTQMSKPSTTITHKLIPSYPRRLTLHLCFYAFTARFNAVPTWRFQVYVSRTLDSSSSWMKKMLIGLKHQ